MIYKVTIILKTKLKNKYEKKTKGTRVRSKWLWYKEDENSLKFFLNLEKRRGIQGQIRKLIVENQETTYQNKIQNELLVFYENHFRNKSTNTEDC